MTTDHRIIVRDNYNAVAQRVAAEWAALDAGHGCDPTRLAEDTAALIDALKRQRDEARAALQEIADMPSSTEGLGGVSYEDLLSTAQSIASDAAANGEEA